MSQSWTILTLLQTTRSYLERQGVGTPRLDAEVLLAHSLGQGRMYLYTHGDKPLLAEEVDSYRALVRRRSQGESVAYLTGEREFYSLPFQVGPGVLIPRPETELLVDKALHLLQPKIPKTFAEEGENPDKQAEVEKAPLLMLDLCTGTGCIPLTLLHHVEQLKAIAGDLSPEALSFAKTNRDSMAMTERLGLLKGDGFDPFPKRFVGMMDLITANPPYLTSEEMDNLQIEVQKEPSLALAGGEDGLDLYRKWVPEALAWLKPGGHLIVEMGAGQGEALLDIFVAAGFENSVVFKDFAHLPRLVQGQRPKTTE